jgi:hypothetical protein
MHKTAAPRELEPNARGCNWGYPVPGTNIYRNLAFQVGGVSKTKTETINYAHEFRGIQISERLR